MLFRLCPRLVRTIPVLLIAIFATPTFAIVFANIGSSNMFIRLIRVCCKNIKIIEFLLVRCIYIKFIFIFKWNNRVNELLLDEMDSVFISRDKVCE